MHNKKLMKFAALFLSASMLLGAGAYAEEETEKAQVGLSIAGDAGASNDTETETETEEKETETEAKVVYDQLEATSTKGAAIETIDVSAIVENTMPAIVAITNTGVSEVESYFYGTQEIESSAAGSGIIIAQNDTELLIATNNHMVEGAKELTVCFSVDAEDQDDLLVPAVIKGTASHQDLAVIAVKLADIKEDVFKQLKVATLGSSSSLKVGQAAIVIGNALGTGQTVTTGIISALEREIHTEVGTFTEIQTDAAINFGCSGGAILNAKGEVIGVTDAKATAEHAESMGYGIPIDTAIPIFQDLINRETREIAENRGYMGITVLPVSDEAKEMYNMPAGAFVYEVTDGSAADKAGIIKGNIITAFDGITVGSSDALVDLMRHYEVGETVTVTLMYAEGGSYESKDVEVTLQEGAETDKEEELKEDAEDDSKEEKQNDDSIIEDEKDDNGGSGRYYDEMFGDDDDMGGYDNFEQFFFGNGFDQFFGQNRGGSGSRGSY